MTATYTWDVFSRLDGYGSHNGDWGGYCRSSSTGPPSIDLYGRATVRRRRGDGCGAEW